MPARDTSLYSSSRFLITQRCVKKSLESRSYHCVSEPISPLYITWAGRAWHDRMPTQVRLVTENKKISDQLLLHMIHNSQCDAHLIWHLLCCCLYPGRLRQRHLAESLLGLCAGPHHPSHGEAGQMGGERPHGGQSLMMLGPERMRWNYDMSVGRKIGVAAISINVSLLLSFSLLQPSAAQNTFFHSFGSLLSPTWLSGRPGTPPSLRPCCGRSGGWRCRWPCPEPGPPGAPPPPPPRCSPSRCWAPACCRGRRCTGPRHGE